MDCHSAPGGHEAPTHATVCVDPENTEGRKPDTRGHILDDPIYRKCPQ